MRRKLMLEHVMNIDDEEEARRILMKLGNGLTQVDMYIAEWKAAKTAAKPAPIKQKVVTAAAVEKETAAPAKSKTTIIKK
jgi:hypothetical protein